MNDNQLAGGMSTRQARRLLHSAYPTVFAEQGKPKRPLSVNIHRGLHERLTTRGFDIPPGALARALADYCSGVSYLRELHCGATRIDLGGNVAGVVSQWDQDDAERKLRRMGLNFHKLSAEALHHEAA